MSRFLELKEQVKNILLDKPIYAIDDSSGEILTCPDWETVLPRKFEELDNKPTVIIGSANILTATELVLEFCKLDIEEYYSNKKSTTIQIQEEIDEVLNKIFTTIVENLVEERIIRRNPNVVRQGFKVINGKERNEEKSIQTSNE